jgi:type II restriction enzyme
LTRFGRNFPYLQDENIGDLLIICKKTSENYEAYVLQSDEDIDDFFAALNISSIDTNGIIPKQFEKTAEDILYNCFLSFLKSLKIDFPTTLELATSARNCYNKAFSITEKIITANPDQEILNWLNAEFQLFKTIENDRYSKRIQTPFETVEELVEIANTILNRRKAEQANLLNTI